MNKNKHYQGAHNEMKTINNDYDSIAHLWWSEDEGATASIRYLVNPVRFTYFDNLLKINFKSGYENKKVLDVGCGGLSMWVHRSS